MSHTSRRVQERAARRRPASALRLVAWVSIPGAVEIESIFDPSRTPTRPRRNPAKIPIRSVGDFFSDPVRARAHLRKLGRRFAGQPEALGLPVLVGAVPYSLLRQYMPEDCGYITILRHPVYRALAQYRALVDGDAGTGSLEEALTARGSPLPNLATRLLCDDPEVENLTPSALDQARRNLTQFAFVGIEERLSDWIALLQPLVGLPLPPGGDASRIEDDGTPEPSDAERRLIEEHNSLDLELYLFAAELLDERLAASATAAEPLIAEQDVQRFPSIPRGPRDAPVRITEASNGDGVRSTSVSLGHGGGSVRARFFGYAANDLDILEEVVGALDVRQGSPPIYRFENVIYQPRATCLYDDSGVRIIETCRVRHPQLVNVRSTSPETIPLPRDLPTFDGPVVYVGPMTRHWGIFQTEGISRAWPLGTNEVPEDAPLVGPRRLTEGPTFITKFFELAGYGLDRLIQFPKPMLLPEVYVPYPAFILHSGGFGAHCAIPERVAERVCSSGCTPRDEPVYLSRSRQPPRKQRYLNEEELEHRLRDRGVRVVYPELLSFEDQIRVVNEHTVFIGLVGSAFHTLLYALPDRRRASFVIEAELNNHVANYLAIDLLKNIRAHYICVEAHDRPRPLKAFGRMDAAAAETWLTSLGALS